VDSFALSRSIAAWYLAIQAASSADVCIIKAALALSALAGVMAAGSALRLRLHDEQEHESEKQDKFLLER
jgi:Na+-transporting NADH:ubiquinone oxidoreductase subunit NqrC